MIKPLPGALAIVRRDKSLNKKEVKIMLYNKSDIEEVQAHLEEAQNGWTLWNCFDYIQEESQLLDTLEVTQKEFLDGMENWARLQEFLDKLCAEAEKDYIHLFNARHALLSWEETIKQILED